LQVVGRFRDDPELLRVGALLEVSQDLLSRRLGQS
jgi:hypothetical protein